MYNLYALIVHHGRSVSSGHYIAYVKAPNGYWWLCDDTNLKQVGLRAACFISSSQDYKLDIGSSNARDLTSFLSCLYCALT